MWRGRQSAKLVPAHQALADRLRRPGQEEIERAVLVVTASLIDSFCRWPQSEFGWRKLEEKRSTKNRIFDKLLILLALPRRIELLFSP